MSVGGTDTLVKSAFVIAKQGVVYFIPFHIASGAELTLSKFYSQLAVVSTILTVRPTRSCGGYLLSFLKLII